jgi:hypothetical protein
VRDLDEAHAALDQPAREQAALAELAAVRIAQVGLFFVEPEGARELRSCSASGSGRSPRRNR